MQKWEKSQSPQMLEKCFEMVAISDRWTDTKIAQWGDNDHEGSMKLRFESLIINTARQKSH